VTDRDEDDPQLKSLRAVWLSMPDEDPPERGLAELMMAARAKAEHMTKPSWWQQVLAVLRRPAVLALASVLVLLGGVVLIGRRGDKMEAPSGLPSPSVEQVPDSTRNVEKNDQAPAAKEEPPREMNHASRPRGETPLPRHEVPAARTPVEDRESVSGADVEMPAQGLAAGNASQAAPGEPTPTPGPQKAPAAPGATGQQKAPAGQQKAPAAPSPTPSDATTPAGAKAESRSPKPESRSLAQARAAATRGDCNAARTIASGIAKQDPQYYRTVVLADASIKKCVLRE